MSSLRSKSKLDQTLRFFTIFGRLFVQIFPENRPYDRDLTRTTTGRCLKVGHDPLCGNPLRFFMHWLTKGHSTLYRLKFSRIEQIHYLRHAFSSDHLRIGALMDILSTGLVTSFGPFCDVLEAINHLSAGFLAGILLYRKVWFIEFKT